MDVEAMRALLDNNFGATKGPNAPTSFELALFAGDPRLRGDEDTDAAEIPSSTTIAADDGTTSAVPNGYARVVVQNNGVTFPPADLDGIKTTPPLAFPVATAEYPEAATHWALFAAGVLWASAPFSEGDEVVIQTPGQVPTVTLSLFFNPYAE